MIKLIRLTAHMRSPRAAQLCLPAPEVADTPARPTVGVSAANHGPLPKIRSATLTVPPPLITAGPGSVLCVPIASRGRTLSGDIDSKQSS